MRIKPGAVISVFAVIALAWLAFERVRFATTELKIKFAREQVELFDELAMRAFALDDEEEIRRIKHQIEWYYPSGTKQTKGSHLDAIVESARHNACKRLDSYLLELTPDE